MPRRPLAAALLSALALGAAGCVTQNPVPTPAPTPFHSPAPTPVPKATAHPYTVRPNDTLVRIARRFDLTVGQLLTANPQLTDPNLVQVGQVLQIPAPGAPDTSPASGGIADGRDDLVDPSENPVTGEGYADIDGLGIRYSRGQVRIELGLTSKPPGQIDPEYEALMYTVVIDVDDDGQPDYRLRYGNDGEETGALAVSLEDRTTGQIRSGGDFPGTFELKPNGALVWTVQQAALGGGARWRIAGKAERSSWPGGRNDPEVETTVDLAPNQQWPRLNPRWVELGAPVRTPPA
ncbi:MAG: LysM domain-containing protein [Chloroflexota bacterium]